MLTKSLILFVFLLPSCSAAVCWKSEPNATNNPAVWGVVEGADLCVLRVTSSTNNVSGETTIMTERFGSSDHLHGFPSHPNYCYPLPNDEDNSTFTTECVCRKPLCNFAEENEQPVRLMLPDGQVTNDFFQPSCLSPEAEHIFWLGVTGCVVGFFSFLIFKRLLNCYRRRMYAKEYEMFTQHPASTVIHNNWTVNPSLTKYLEPIDQAKLERLNERAARNASNSVENRTYYRRNLCTVDENTDIVTSTGQNTSSANEEIQGASSEGLVSIVLNAVGIGESTEAVEPTGHTTTTTSTHEETQGPSDGSVSVDLNAAAAVNSSSGGSNKGWSVFGKFGTVRKSKRPQPTPSSRP